MQLGPIWTLLIVAQVALCLAGLPLAMELAWGTLRPGILGPGFASEQYLTARLEFSRFGQPVTSTSSLESAAEFRRLREQLVPRLTAEAGILSVTMPTALPGAAPFVTIEIDKRSQDARLDLHDGAFCGSSVNQVEDNFFDVLEMSLLAGRGFAAGPFKPDQREVIVNRNLATHLVGDGNPLGLRIRPIVENSRNESEPGPWHQIVGVVSNLPKNDDAHRLYLPNGSLTILSTTLVMRTTPGSTDLTSRVREATLSLHPDLEVGSFRTLADLYAEQAIGNNIGASVLAAVTISLLLLSAAGLYALMSFIVTQRRQEIGIRSALGARPHELLRGIFRRAFTQIAAGALLGALTAFLIGLYIPTEQLGGRSLPWALPTAALLMMLIGVLASLGPARTALQVAPNDVLKDG